MISTSLSIVTYPTGRREQVSLNIAWVSLHATAFHVPEWSDQTIKLVIKVRRALVAPMVNSFELEALTHETGTAAITAFARWTIYQADARRELPFIAWFCDLWWLVTDGLIRHIVK